MSGINQTAQVTVCCSIPLHKFVLANTNHLFRWFYAKILTDCWFWICVFWTYSEYRHLQITFATYGAV